MNVRVFNSTNFIVPDSALNPVPMNTPEYDTGVPAFFDGANVTIPVDGIYAIVGDLVAVGSGAFSGGALLLGGPSLFPFAASYAHSRVVGDSVQLDVSVSAIAHFTAGTRIALGVQMSVPGSVSTLTPPALPHWSPALSVSLLTAD